MKIYFAHPITSYHTDLEQRIVSALADGGFDIVNPSDPVHQGQVDFLRTQHEDRNVSSRIIMDYFVSVCDGCDSCAVLAFPDGTLGAGVVREAQSFLDRGKQAYEVRVDESGVKLVELHSLDKYQCLDVDATRAALKKFGAPKP